MKKINMTDKRNHATQFNTTSWHWLDQFKVSAIAAAITTLICSSVPSYASDAEIYVVPANVTGATTLMMMLDISGSMKDCDEPSGVSSTTKNSTTVITHNGFSTSYTRTYCEGTTTERHYYFKRTGTDKNGNPYVYYKCSGSVSPNYSTNKNDCGFPGGSKPSDDYSNDDKKDPRYYYKDESLGVSEEYPWRITRVQDAMIAMLNGNATTTKLADNLVIGLSTLGRRSSQDYDTGQILVPARALSTVLNSTTGLTQRDLLIQKVAAMTAPSWTPTGRSYAETAAYLLGTHTKHTAGTTSESINGVSTSYPYGSGFLFSDSSTKNAAGTAYAAPSSITRQIGTTVEARNARECSGQGIYVLTDGEPNNWSYTSNTMQTALTTSAFSSDFSCTANDWACIHKFANYLKDPTKNPAGLEFRTAVVGFGGETFPVGAQTWGRDGGGGFYLGRNAQDVVDSVKNFLKDIVKDVPSMSTGASTIPLDALNPEMIQPYAYFPQFEPKINPTETQQLWLGNMKKYYVVDNEVSASASGGAAYTVVKKSKLQDLADAWSTGNMEC